MKKGNIFLRTVLSTVAAALGLAVSASAEEEPAIERDTVLLEPLYFVKNGSVITDENENQSLWNELMKYKLWGTESVIFNKGNFRIADPSGYTGSATGDIVFNTNHHTLGGPIVSGRDLVFAMGDATRDSLIGGSIYARNLNLPGWYKASDARYDGNICFEGPIIFNSPDKDTQTGDYVWTLNRFIENAHNEIKDDENRKEGKVYADWALDLPSNYQAAVNLDGTFSTTDPNKKNNCPTDVPRPEKELSVPLMQTPSNWGPAIDVSANVGNIVFVHVPPITETDLKQSPKKVWYDQYVEDLRASGSTGLIIYIVMPSNKWNANKKTGRLTRIFSRDGFNVMGSANDLRIQVAIANENAVWNSSTQMWENLNEPEWDPSTSRWKVSEDKPYWEKETGWHNLDKLNINPVADSNYAGNLLFYTPVDVNWDAMVNIHYQGTFMTAGNFTIEDHINIAGQLIAGKTLKFESDVNGEFHYVPFNAAEIKSDIFSSDVFKESETVWYDMNFYLTDTAHTEVSFDYCLAFFGLDVEKPASWVNAGREFAEIADLDLDDKTHPMPLCSKGESGHVVIAKNTRHPTAATMPYIKVKLDGVLESDEWMLFKITNMNGATISGGRFDGGIPVKLIDDDNKPPHFIDVDKIKLTVPENATKAKAGTIKASDDENDSFTFEITGGNAKDMFDIGLTSGVVTLKSSVDPLDYEEWVESKTSYTIKVEVCDTRAGSYSVQLCSQATFKVNVGDENEKPYFTNKTDVIEIAENASFSSDDVLYDDTDKYNTNEFINNELAIVGGDSDIFDITTGGQIKPKKGVVLDYEVKQEYEIVVRVRDKNKDGDGNFVYPDLYEDKTFKVVVTDVDDGPKFDYAAYNGTIDENSVATTAVKMDHAINATTTQVGAVITYSLVDETNTFVIDPTTGVITVAAGAVLDYETKSTYSLDVIASDESGVAGQIVQTDKATVTITLKDVNEKPVFVEPTTTLAFDEHVKGAIVGTLTFDDLDTASKFRNNKFECLDCDDKGFDLDEDTGLLKTTRAFDYETEEHTYELSIVIKDAGDKNLTATGTITVTLRNVNEPPFLKETVFTVLESDPAKTELKNNLDGFDTDGPDITFSYYIMDGDKEGHSTNEFYLDPLTGVFTVTSTAKLDYEKTESYSFKVRIKDEHCPNSTTEESYEEKWKGCHSDTTVTIKVVDVNEAPSINVDTIYVKENQEIKKPFETVKTDKDDPDVKNADFRDNVYENIDNSEIFSVQPNGDVILLKPIDYEADSIYVIKVRVTDKNDKTLTSTKNVVIKVKDVYEKSIVEITRVENKDSVYIKPDSVFVNDKIVDIEWTADNKLKNSTDTLKLGCNTVIKTFKDPTKNDPGVDTVVICYSTAAPIVTVTANGEDVTADNIYTVVEKATKNDSAIYVNEKKNNIKVTVKDTAAKVTKSFNVNLELDTISVSSKDFKNVQTLADTKTSRKSNPSSGITTTPENGSYNKNTYTETINGVNVTVSYYTDSKGNDVKRTVVTSDGKTKEIAVIEISYTVKINGKDVVISYFADASSGERVNLKTGLTDSESVLSADGDDVVGSYKVSYTYTDKNGNTVDVSYYLDDKGKIAKNSDGNIGYNVGYTYVNKFGNSSKKEVLIVLDQKGPVVKIESPTDGEVLTSNFAEVIWTVDGVEQDTLRVQGLDNGAQTIIRVFRDKAGNESSDSVSVMVKGAKNIDISVEKPVTLVDRDSVIKYYETNKKTPKKDQTYSVTFYNHKKKAETEALIGIKGKANEGSGEEPYPGFEGHLGPTLTVDARVPVATATGGLATLDDIVSAGGMVALEGVDAANGKKISVSEYVEKYCTDEFKKSMTSDYSKMNLYWTTIRVNIWTYSNTGVFADHYSFDYDLDDPDYVNEAGLLKFFFEMKPDKNGDVRTKEGRLYGTGAYLFKTEVKMTSKLRCTLPPVSEDKAEKKKNAIIKSNDEMLKSFGYRRPVNK
ncbi:cadherin domain-containing protein [Fibrobacter sp. UWB12]|uniref:cadherin domain-containing protein n=1 Tax=Fibrobacter sp. UWB12 TaxID=1896203 RepID=UPI0009179A9C|nr:cadherin domain-containing protein [Fibrobacter sp. UWB12]SHK36525.1 Cadherin domain-containing protein [Fibrobacter sp. UWB12]